jgi:hypothetical protein
MQTIPLPTGQAHFDQSVDLEGTTYILTFAWNAREARWAVDVSTAEGALLVGGVTCASNRLLLRRYRHVVGLPPGDLMFVDLTESVDGPGYPFDVELVYFLGDELGAT